MKCHVTKRWYREKGNKTRIVIIDVLFSILFIKHIKFYSRFQQEGLEENEVPMWIIRETYGLKKLGRSTVLIWIHVWCTCGAEERLVWLKQWEISREWGQDQRSD